MGNELRIGDTLTEAFRFALVRWPTLLRIIWAPLIGILLLVFVTLYTVFDVEILNAMGANNSGYNAADALNYPIAVSIIILLGVFAFAIYISSGLQATIYRLVALGETPSGFIHIRFDDVATRVFFANGIIGALTILGAIACLIVFLLFGGGEISGLVRDMVAAGDTELEMTPAHMEALQNVGGASFIVVVLTVISVVYFGVKLTPFLPATAVENRIAFLTSFRLTKGRFWSVFGTMLLAALAMLLVTTFYQLVVGIFSLIASMNTNGAFAVLSLLATLVQLALVFTYQVFAIGVQMSLPAIIYRRLKTGA